VRFVKVSTFVVLAFAIPAVAQSPRVSGQGSGRSGIPAARQTQQLPKPCLVQEHPSEQITALLETIRDHPTAGAYNTLGALYAQDRRTTCAIAAFEGALRLEPGDWQAHYNLGLAVLTKGDRSRAASEFQSAILQKPDSVAPHFALGTLLQEAGKFDGAAKEFESALQNDPNFAPAQFSLGVLYTQQEKDPEAAALFRRAIQNDPNNVQAHVNLGLTMARLGDLSEAEQEFKSAIQIDPKNATAFTSLGMLEAKTGRGGDAVESFRKVVALQPDSAEAHLNLGIALVDKYDRTGGFKEFKEAARLNPKSPRAHYNLGRFFFEAGRYEEARKQLERDGRANRRLARVLGIQGGNREEPCNEKNRASKKLRPAHDVRLGRSSGEAEDGSDGLVPQFTKRLQSALTWSTRNQLRRQLVRSRCLLA